MKKTITLQLDANEVALLDSLKAHFGKLASPTSIVAMAAQVGLIRMAADEKLTVKGFSENTVLAALSGIKR